MTKLAGILISIVADNTKTVLVIIISNNDYEDNSIIRVVKLVLLNLYNGNREKLSL